MTDHPITPPPELVQQLCDSAALSRSFKNISIKEVDVLLILEAFQAGADQELEACCAWLGVQETQSPQWFDLRHDACALVSDLRAARRPKLPTLKEQALLQLDTLNADLAMHGRGCDLSQIRRALEALPND